MQCGQTVAAALDNMVAVIWSLSRESTLWEITHKKGIRFGISVKYGKNEDSHVKKNFVKMNIYQVSNLRSTVRQGEFRSFKYRRQLQNFFNSIRYLTQVIHFAPMQ